LKDQKASTERMKKDLQKKLQGDLIPVTLFCDVDPTNFSVYFAVKSDDFDNFIEIKRFDPTQTKKNMVKAFYFDEIVKVIRFHSEVNTEIRRVHVAKQRDRYQISL
jgi:hypothetical protein